MPELPEVETTRRGIEPHILGRQISAVVVREHRLRWPVDNNLSERLVGGSFLKARRRAKYLLLDSETGTLMVHLGMSGSLRVMTREEPPMFHDHIDIHFDGGLCLRYNDPRRFGSFHWLQSDDHPLLNHLGPEPLLDNFDGAWLYNKSRGRRSSVKQFLMDGKIVVGVGNIYEKFCLS